MNKVFLIEVSYVHSVENSGEYRLELSKNNEFIETTRNDGISINLIIPKPMYNAIRYLLVNIDDVLEFTSNETATYWKVIRRS